MKDLIVLATGELSVPAEMDANARSHAITGLTKATALDGRPFDIACRQIDIGNAATELTERMASGVLQADGSVKPEARRPVEHVAQALVYVANLPLDANVLFLTVMATQCLSLSAGSKAPLTGRIGPE